MELFCKTLPKAVSTTAYVAIYLTNKILRHANNTNFCMWLCNPAFKDSIIAVCTLVHLQFHNTPVTTALCCLKLAAPTYTDCLTTLTVVVVDLIRSRCTEFGRR